jgi:hypothetical protein
MNAELTADQLLKEASQLSRQELDQFVSKIISLRAQRTAPSLPGKEAELLRRINLGVPTSLQERFADLAKKRDAEALTPEEHEELKGLTLEAERIEADRIRDLSELASLRGTTLSALMESLGLGAPGYA